MQPDSFISLTRQSAQDQRRRLRLRRIPLGKGEAKVSCLAHEFVMGLIYSAPPSFTPCAPPQNQPRSVLIVDAQTI